METDVVLRKRSLTESNDNKRLCKNQSPKSDQNMFSLKPSDLSL